jgi:hypothetical protein
MPTSQSRLNWTGFGKPMMHIGKNIYLAFLFYFDDPLSIESGENTDWPPGDTGLFFTIGVRRSFSIKRIKSESATKSSKFNIWPLFNKIDILYGIEIWDVEYYNRYSII